MSDLLCPTAWPPTESAGRHFAGYCTDCDLGSISATVTYGPKHRADVEVPR